jgi:hypothetical protein
MAMQAQAQPENAAAAIAVDEDEEGALMGPEPTSKLTVNIIVVFVVKRSSCEIQIFKCLNRESTE